MENIVFQAIGLLSVAVLIAIIARRIHLPYTVGLVLVGIALSFSRFDTGINLTHEILFNVILPPLIFEAALNIHWAALRRDLAPVLVLAMAGVVISASIVAGGVMHFLGWPVTSALVFGVLIAATDPVAVIAMFKDVGVKGRLRLLVEGESLLNDGVAAVLFVLALQWAASSGEGLAVTDVAMTLIKVSGGGIAAGLVCGGLAVLVAGRTSDHLVETALTVIAAYGSFLLAEHFHMSGVLAALAAGLLMGNVGVLRDDEASPVSHTGRTFVLEFWDFAAFIANSIIFLMIGLTMARIPASEIGLAAIALVIALTLIGRGAAVYPICLLFRRGEGAVPPAYRHILWWGGLRGALALGLALSLPETLPRRDDIVIAAFCAVGFSVVVQGVTMKRVLRALGLLKATSA